MMKWILRGTLVMAVVNLVLLFFAHSFFAVNAPLGADAVVVEGWLEGEALDAASREVLERDARLVFTTGTYRAFRHYLNVDESLELDLNGPVEGVPVIQVAGTKGAGFTLLDGPDTLAHQTVQGQVVYFTCAPVEGRHLSIRSWHTDPHFDRGTRNIFIRAFKIAGRNMNELVDTVMRVTNAGDTLPARTTEAWQARDELVQRGVPAARIHAIPTDARPGNRTRASASRVAEALAEAEVRQVDVITLGVHARRTRGLLRKASEDRFTVGVVSLPDPECPPGSWWRSGRGWGKVLKEVVGLGQGGAAPDAE